MVGPFPLRVTGAVAAALALAPIPPAAAQSGGYGILREAPSATEYATPDGEVRFVLDRRTGGRAALVRFQGDPEVHVLVPRMGRDGDEIYTNASGTIVLRITSHGGVVVYTQRHPDGAPAAEGDAAQPLRPESPPPNVYAARMRELQVAAQRRLGRPVAFVAPAAPPEGSSGVVLDAAARATDGIAVPQSAAIRRILFVLGPQPAVAVRGDTLIIQIAPGLGYAGRPSSAAIRTVVQRSAQGPEQ